MLSGSLLKLLRQGVQQKGNLFDRSRHQNHAFVHRALFQIQNALRRNLVPRVTAETPNGFRWIGEHAALMQSAASAV
jgi:hypothetical protein